ncbi:MAG: M15 family metallopeptidase [Clostridia bacterium]|nr:M15 family metallopeptidase [Clostridia bacterium]
MQKMGLAAIMLFLIIGSFAFLRETEVAMAQVPETVTVEVEEQKEPEPQTKEAIETDWLALIEAEMERETETTSRENCLLVNGDNPVPENYAVDLVDTGRQNSRGDSRAVAALNLMLKAGEREGLAFVVCSGYRNREEQQVLFLNQIKKKLDEGLGYQEALAAASRISALPGTSEHETGLAFDIVALSYQNLDQGYADTPEAKWLAENAVDYGFILRYPEGKEEVTGIIWEPWHYRYVGVSIARAVTGAGITLEEYLAEN